MLLLFGINILKGNDEIHAIYYEKDKPLIWEPSTRVIFNSQTPTIEYDTEPPVPIWVLRCDGSTERARVTDMPANDLIRSNLGIIFMHTDSSYNYKFIYNPDDIIAGKTRTAEWGLKVVDLRYDARAVITFTDYIGNDTTITINYYAPTVTIRPEYQSFGIVKKGAVVFSDFWLINKSESVPAVVNQLELKNKNQGFDISEIILPITLQPKDSVKFRVIFYATEEGNFTDSLGIGNNCFFINTTLVEAKVRQSIINVSDALFEDLPIRKTATKTVEIKNDGNVDLIITGYKGPANSAFKVNLPEITSFNPLIIKPEDPPYKFEVEFSPLLEQIYHDSIVFFSDADRIDSVAVLNGNGIQPGMISTSFDWRKRRIGKEYPAENQCILIENTSDGDVTIYGFAKKVDNGGSVFDFDKKLLENVTVGAGKTIYIPVKFKPVDVGKYELVIVYDNSINSQTETRLSGIGVDPRLETQNVAFDTSVVAQYTNPVHDTVRFKNVDWEYADTIRINDLRILPNGDEISTDLNNYGKSGFKFDKNSLNLPRILLPGEELEIPMMFVSQKSGDVVASIETISDVVPEATSNIHGYGRNQKINVKPITSFPNTCLGNQDTITYLIENLGNELIDVTSIEIEKDMFNNFSFENLTDALGFIVDPGKSEKVNIIYKPDRAGQSLADLVVYNNTLYNSYYHNQLEGEGIQKKRKIHVDLLQGNNFIQIGNKFQCSIVMEPGDDIDFINVQELNVEIRYNGGIIKATPDDIRIGDLLEGRFQINNLKIKDNPGIISLTLDTLSGIPNQKLTGDGELLKIIFNTYLPSTKDSSDRSIIEPFVSPVRNSCVNFSDAKTITVQVDPVCLNEIRKIDINSLGYSLSAINPNPVSSGTCDVYYSIGLEGMTKFEIMNYHGSVVYSRSINNQKPGVYSFKIPSEDLESGVYWCRMISGPYSSVKEFIIIK